MKEGHIDDPHDPQTASAPASPPRLSARAAAAALPALRGALDANKVAQTIMPHPLQQTQLMQAAILQQAAANQAAILQQAASMTAGQPKASTNKPRPLIDQSKCTVLKLRLPKSPGMAGLTLRDDEQFALPILIDVHQRSPLKEQVPSSLCGEYWIVSINEFAISTGEGFAKELRACQRPDREVTVDVAFCKRGTATLPEGTRGSSKEEGKKGTDGASTGAGDVEEEGEADISDDEDDVNPHNHSQEELDRIKAIKKESKELFPPGRKDIVYEKAKALMDAYNEQIASKYGFKLEKRGSAFRCSRSTAAPRKENTTPENKKRKHLSNRCGCEFKMNFSYALTEEGRTKIKTEGKRRCPVYLTGCNYRHTNGCSGFLPKMLTYKERLEKEREERGARKLKRKHDPNKPKTATEMLDQFRPMFRSLAKVPNPQQKHYLKVLEGVKDLVEESVAEHDAAAAATAAAANTAADDEEEHYAGLMA
ncbi:hypothetical protein ACHAXT_007925 [Thalassiosira profunda]